MGEVSGNVVVVLAVAVLLVSAIGTWLVMESALDAFGGLKIPVSSSLRQSDVVKGFVNVYVNGTASSAASSEGGGTLTGMVGVFVNSTK